MRPHNYLRDATLGAAERLTPGVAVVAVTCGKCGDLKMPHEFHRAAKRPGGLQAKCRDCRNGETAGRSERVREIGRASRRKTYTLNKYGITREEYERRRDASTGCEICGGQNPNGKPLHLDHCHATGVLRGFLCENHNRGLGMFADDPDLLRRAAEYLERGTNQPAGS